VGIKDMINKSIEDLQGALVDAEKFLQGNNTAGTRVRKTALQVKNDMHTLRAMVTDLRAKVTDLRSN
jgi:hypothetical protein